MIVVVPYGRKDKESADHLGARPSLLNFFQMAVAAASCCFSAASFTGGSATHRFFSTLRRPNYICSVQGKPKKSSGNYAIEVIPKLLFLRYCCTEFDVFALRSGELIIDVIE